MLDRSQMHQAGLDGRVREGRLDRLRTAGEPVEQDVGVSKEPCQADRKDSLCLRLRNARWIKRKMFCTVSEERT